MNKVILIGRIGKDAEVRKFESGAVKVTFTMATSEKYKGKDGNMVEQTEWHNVEMWGERAGKVAPYLLKGTQVMVEGKIRYDEYEKDGVKRRATSIACREFEFLSSKKQDGQQAQSQQTDARYQYQQQQPQTYTQPTPVRQQPTPGDLPPIPEPQRIEPPMDDTAFSDDLPF